MSENKVGKKINILSGIESDILNIALYALFTLVIMTAGTMGSITAAGLSEERIKCAMRFSFSKYTTFEELDLAVKAAAEFKKLCLLEYQFFNNNI